MALVPVSEKRGYLPHTLDKLANKPSKLRAQKAVIYTLSPKSQQSPPARPRGIQSPAPTLHEHFFIKGFLPTDSRLASQNPEALTLKPLNLKTLKPATFEPFGP